jgi:hypothetical protein
MNPKRFKFKALRSSVPIERGALVSLAQPILQLGSPNLGAFCDFARVTVFPILLPGIPRKISNMFVCLNMKRSVYVGGIYWAGNWNVKQSFPR